MSNIPNNDGRNFLVGVVVVLVTIWAAGVKFGWWEAIF